MEKEDIKLIDQFMAEYRMALVTAKREGRELPKPPGAIRPPRPKLTAAEKLARVQERLTRLRAALHKDDARRIQRLLSEAKLHGDAGDMLAVYGIAAEIMHTAKVHVLGLEQTYPVLSSIPPAPSTGFTTHPAPKSATPPLLPTRREIVDDRRNEEPDEDSEGES